MQTQFSQAQSHLSNQWVTVATTRLVNPYINFTASEVTIHAGIIQLVLFAHLQLDSRID